MVELYSTSWCGYCTRAKDYMQANNIAFKEYDVESSATYKRKFKELGGTGYPFIVVGKKTMQGWNPERLQALLEH